MQQFDEQDYTQRFSLSLWRKILLYAKEYYPDLIRLAVTMAVTAGCDVVFPLMTTYAIDHFIPNLDHAGTMEGLPGFIGVYLLILGIQVASIFYFLYLGGKIEVGVCYTIRKQAFRKLQELPFSYYDRMPVGYLMSRMTSDTQRLAETIGWSMLDLAWGAVMLVAASVTMLVLNWKMALMVMLVVPPLALVSWWFQQRILKAYRAVRKTNSKITGAFNEGIMGAKTTKTLVREEMNMEEFTALTRDMKKSSVRVASLSAVYLPIVVALGSLATAYALWKGGSAVLVGGMTLGVLQAFINYTVQFFEPIRNIANVFAEMQSAQAAAERVLTLLETKPDIVDTPEVEETFGDNFHPKKENWPELHGDVEFCHVDFQYKEGEKVLSDFNLKIKAGETIALVGPTGA
ncbi:MAG: ABC transporter ATP-binding protein, partial [Clostridia bacterium]|nr:ABC transporter ATP-binding protein [Clostridia bacterium]